MKKIIKKIAIPFTVREMLHHDTLPLEQLQEIQWQKISTLLQFAYERSPFYRRRFQTLGAEPGDIRSLRDFEALPVLTRDDVRYHAEEMLTYPKEKLRLGHSGGSTGYSLDLYMKPEHKHYLWAARKRVRHWLGADRLWPYFTLWGATTQSNVPERIGRWDRITKKQYRYGFCGIGQTELAGLVEDLLLVRPRMVFGYASLLRALAFYILANNIRIKKPPACVISTAETLPNEDRALIERGLSAPVYNAYGANENGDIACECLERHGQHVLVDHVHLEILNNGQAVSAGVPGYLVITDLDNLAMPYIRYQNADIGAWSTEACPCGRTLPMLQTVFGRHTDFVVDGKGVAYPGINLMHPLRGLEDPARFRQFQILQNTQGRIEVLVVPGKGMEPSDTTQIIRALKEAIRGPIEIEVRIVDQIPVESSGKSRFVKSAVPFSEAIGVSGVQCIHP